MSKEDMISMKGTVTEALPATLFQVKLENDHTILCHLAGKMRMHNIKVILGDRVDVEMSTYDLTKGRITYRYK